MRVILWCLFSLLLLWPAGARAAVIFDTSFETCATTAGPTINCEGWLDLGQGAAGRIEIVADGNCLSGTKCIKETWISASGAGAQPSIYTSPAPYSLDEIYVRYPTRRSVSWTPSTNVNTKLMILGDPGVGPRTHIQDLGGPYGVTFECPYNVLNPNGTRATTINYSSGVASTPGGWDQIELRIKLNTPGQADGIVQMWVNNVLTALNKTGLELRGPTPTSSNPGCGTILSPSTYKFNHLQLFVQSGVGTRHTDRISVCTGGRCGLVSGSTPPPVDTVAPTPPTSVRVN